MAVVKSEEGKRLD